LTRLRDVGCHEVSELLVDAFFSHFFVEDFAEDRWRVGIAILVCGCCGGGPGTLTEHVFVFLGHHVSLLDEPISLLARELLQLVLLELVEFKAAHDLVALVVALALDHDGPVFVRVEPLVGQLLVLLLFHLHQHIQLFLFNSAQLVRHRDRLGQHTVVVLQRQFFVLRLFEPKQPQHRVLFRQRAPT